MNTSEPKPFKPLWPMKNAMLQTVLASSRLRIIGKDPMSREARKMIFTTSQDVRLMAWYSPQTDGRSRGLVILLNGWQGCATSAYMVATGKMLYHHGYSVLRLEYRDHGDSHHLNKGLFYATLLKEVLECVAQAARLEAPRPAFLAGFSLGGNFALRIARECGSGGMENLQHIVSISPVLDPQKSTDAINRNAVINSYFLKKWKRSLYRKQRLFPSLYDFTDILGLNDIRTMTEMLISKYSLYENAAQYFSAYSVGAEDLSGIVIPTTIIAAKDDPIIPAEDFYSLCLNDTTRLCLHKHGGHNGFFESFRLNTWYEKEMIHIFNRLT
jgi:uncharacterized protein